MSSPAPRKGFLGTRVARRVLFLFVVGALVPVVAMAGVSFAAVNRQLEAQGEARLRQLSKNLGQAVIQQLDLVETELRAVMGPLAVGVEPGPALARLRAIEALQLTGPAGREILHGRMEPVQDPEGGERERLREGETVLRVSPTGADLVMAAALDPDAPRPTVVWARVQADSVWASAAQVAQLPGVTGFCVLDHTGRSLHCEGDPEVAATFPSLSLEGTSGIRRVDAAGAGHLVGFWKPFLAPSFGIPEWTAVVSESDAAMYAPLDAFAYSFPLALFLGVLAVLLLANIQVRRTMEPLERLTEGTHRISAGDLDSRVEVASDDEFRTLADSFNQMADHVASQFHQLEAGWAIDRAVLSALDRSDVIRALLDGLTTVVPGDEAALLLMPSDGTRRGTFHCSSAREFQEQPVELEDADLGWLRESPQHRVVEGAGELPPGLRACGFRRDTGWIDVFPLRAKGKVRGAVLSGGRSERRLSTEEVARVRKLVDQAAVAFEEVRLLHELDEMGWGTLRALARAIDAKSPWTAGHSERVTELAMLMAEEAGISGEDATILNRGALLHDVGKIGVPAEILNFPGRLDPAQRAVMESHPEIGARILDPIRAFHPALPIVLQHHERWDGLGYPHKARGEGIHYLARVLSVADVYDAMVSPRPYRGALAPDHVLREIQGDSGTAFDPEAVALLEGVLERGWMHPLVSTPTQGVGVG